MSTDSTPTPSDPPSRTATPNRFANHTDTLEDALKYQTVGLVHLADFKKRRTELAEQRDREAAEKFQSAGAPRGGSGSNSREGSVGPDKAPKKKRKTGVIRGKLSFAGEEDDDDIDGADTIDARKQRNKSRSVSRDGSDEAEVKEDNVEKRRKFNPKLKAPPPKALTKSTLLREAQEREMLRREFLQLQEKIKNEEITIPFVFYDGM
jgi:protein FAM50